MTITDHHASRYVAEPLRLLDCNIETDGACALIVTSTERARDLRQRPAIIHGGEHRPRPRDVDAFFCLLVGRPSGA
jgi:acetyl-CoA acetyltransferase